MNTLGSFFTVLIILLVITFALFKRIPVFNTFTKGAKEGLISTLSIAPTVIALIIATEMFKASGCMDILVILLNPIAKILNIPKAILPLMIVKPLSGSSSLALVSSIFKDFGPDSFTGMLASLIMASTETTFYVLTVYLALSKLKLSKKIVVIALLVNVFSFLFSSALAKLIF